MERLNISCHHGDIHHQNNLSKVKKLVKHYPEIDIFEIDFISFDDKIISSHDYNMSVIKEGSVLEKWVQFLVIEKRKILWLDIKENLTIYMNCGFEKFDTHLLFSKLKSLRRLASFDITPYIWIGCQEIPVRQSIVEKNKRLSRPWQLILDMPTVPSYMLQRITPNFARGYLREMICHDFMESGYEEYSILTIDQSFFLSREEIISFIKSLKLEKETKIVINSFDRSVEPIRIKNHYIIMQYDYTVSYNVD
jgi:hypothetical protein